MVALCHVTAAATTASRVAVVTADGVVMCLFNGVLVLDLSLL